MLAGIAKFFETYLSPSSERSAADDTPRLQLATAALLIELCKSDHDLHDDETATLLDILRRRFGLADGQLEELLQLATQEAREATSLYQFTSLFNARFSYEEKLALLRNLWEVAYADGRLDRYEEHLIRKVTELMYVSHSDFIRLKLEVRQALDRDAGSAD